MEEYKYIYIKRDEQAIYIGFNEPLDPEINSIGSTWEDYISSRPAMWVPLSEEQIAFKEANPKATVKEVFNMEITPVPEPTPEELLEEAKNLKLNEIRTVTPSKMLFDSVPTWFTDKMEFKNLCSRKSQVLVNDVMYSSDVISALIDKQIDYEYDFDSRQSELIAQVKAATTVEEVQSITTTGFPNTVETTQAEIEAEISGGANRSLEEQAVAFSRMAINMPMMANYISPADALGVQDLYPIWGEKGAELGKTVQVGFRLNFKQESEEEYTLYEVIQEHGLSENWMPGVGTDSLYKVVQEEHAGTLEDPIPWKQGMELENGLYYTDKDVLYKCIRDSGQGMKFDLADLVAGGFVEVVE